MIMPYVKTRKKKFRHVEIEPVPTNLGLHWIDSLSLIQP